MVRQELIDRLYRGADPLAGFPIGNFREDLQGWGGEHPIFTRVIDLYRPRVAVEVGSWKGQSSVTIGKAMKAIGTPSALICIDTWLGGLENFLGGQLPMIDGYPSLYYQFAANIILNDLADCVVPIPQTSHLGAAILQAKGVRADVIYIDASHQYKDVLSDLHDYGALLSDGGCIIGDDYHYAWPGVARAAREYAASSGLALYIYETKYFLTRDPSRVPEGCVGYAEKTMYFEIGRGEYVWI